ncbi:MAG: hypothetical protein IKP69_00065 [Oscillospiraceae bacterium]|nr:hypothetical protein [Oscillospiraceae bacterium]
MYILSKNKKAIIAFGASEISALTVQKNIGGKKEEKFCIACGELGSYIIGTYPDEKLALDELSKIFSAIEEGKTSYEMN